MILSSKETIASTAPKLLWLFCWHLAVYWFWLMVVLIQSSFFLMCIRCQNPVENWLCLCCKEVLCSRFVNRHMLMHHQQTGHCLALSYRYIFSLHLCSFVLVILTASDALLFLWKHSDLSVWCFCCEAYLDAQIILQLRPIHQAAYILKFGESPPLPQLWTPMTSLFPTWSMHVLGKKTWYIEFFVLLFFFLVKTKFSMIFWWFQK